MAATETTGGEDGEREFIILDRDTYRLQGDYKTTNQEFTGSYKPTSDRATLNEFFSHSLLMSGIAPTQVQHLAFGFVELHEVLMGPLLKLIQVPLDGILFCCVNCTAQLGVTCKLAESALDPTVYVIDIDIKEHESQDLCPEGHHSSPASTWTQRLNTTLYVYPANFLSTE
ncbi:hypothetical protein BTVI_40233 [Pitangus sulphuratus]|nr:hypothetical protein BTVI_40233 [Pitangus sulphuratus]